jgi:hypothetical protein
MLATETCTYLVPYQLCCLPIVSGTVRTRFTDSTSYWLTQTANRRSKTRRKHFKNKTQSGFTLTLHKFTQTSTGRKFTVKGSGECVWQGYQKNQGTENNEDYVQADVKRVPSRHQPGGNDENWQAPAKATDDSTKIWNGIKTLSFVPMRWGYLWSATTNGPIVHPQDDIWVWSATVEWYWQGKTEEIGEISSSHGGEYDVQNCILGCTAV